MVQKDDVGRDIYRQLDTILRFRKQTKKNSNVLANTSRRCHRNLLTHPFLVSPPHRSP